MKKNKDAEKRCLICGRIIVDKDNETGVCLNCTKKGLKVGTVAVATAPVVAVGVKKYGKQIIKGLGTVVKKIVKI